MILAALAATISGACAPAADDRRWIERAKIAWQHQLRRIPELRPPPDVEVILFDRHCRVSSADALDAHGRSTWAATRHAGRIRTGDGSSVPAEVTSFAGEGAGGGASFVMALPSVWTGKVKAEPLDLDQLTTAVMLHEASHVAQGRLMTRVARLIRRDRLGADFNDDSIQERFEKEPAFAASVREETRLLFAAAAEPDDARARALAAAASARIAARRARWFTGRNRGLSEAEDLFLSVEGAGQYVAYDWLLSPSGGNVAPAIALRGFAQRGRWWSQTQGMALILAVERLGLPGWRGQLWGEPRLIGAQLLTAALGARSAGP